MVGPEEGMSELENVALAQKGQHTLRCCLSGGELEVGRQKSWSLGSQGGGRPGVLFQAEKFPCSASALGIYN